MRSPRKTSSPPPDRSSSPGGVMRRAERHTDEAHEALTATTRQWLRQRPPARRPTQLCMLFPRVANRPAWHWHAPTGTLAALDDLLTDQRGGRAGFPREGLRDLRRLREFCERGQVVVADVGSSVLARLRRAWPWH